MSDDDYAVTVGGQPCRDLSVQQTQMQVIIITINTYYVCVCVKVPSIGILSSYSADKIDKCYDLLSLSTDQL